MFALMIAWAQSPTSGYVAADQDFAGLVTIGFALVFAGWLLFVGIREVRRMRREDRVTHADDVDVYSVPIDNLGPTMADGGEPIASNGRRIRRLTR